MLSNLFLTSLCSYFSLLINFWFPSSVFYSKTNWLSTVLKGYALLRTLLLTLSAFPFSFKPARIGRWSLTYFSTSKTLSTPTLANTKSIAPAFLLEDYLPSVRYQQHKRSQKGSPYSFSSSISSSLTLKSPATTTASSSPLHVSISYIANAFVSSFLSFSPTLGFNNFNVESASTITDPLDNYKDTLFRIISTKSSKWGVTVAIGRCQKKIWKDTNWDVFDLHKESWFFRKTSAH